MFKKRLSNNQYRSIIVARGGDFWVYSYLFAKQDRANIDEGELKVFREIARAYAGMTQAQADDQVADGHWTEICAAELEQGT